MVLENNKYTIQRNVGHFVFARNIFWLLAGPIFLDSFNSQIENDETYTYFLVGYQFYVHLAIYAYMQLLEGLNHVRFDEKLL